MTHQDSDSDDGSGNDAAQGDSKSANRNRLLIATISALAVVGAAAIGLFVNGQSKDDGTHTEPPTLEGPTATSALPSDNDPCDLNRLADSDSWYQPSSQRYNPSLFARREVPSLYTHIGGAANDPEIDVKGQLNLDIPGNQVLYLITSPDPDSKDQLGHPGNGRYYPGSPITPTSQGCWEDINHRVGYPGAKGLSETYQLVLVGSDQAAKFPAERKKKDWDGYSPDQWKAITTIEVLRFHVSTA